MKGIGSVLLSAAGSILLALSACSTYDTKSDDARPQTIVTSDSSDAAGRLYVKVFNSSGSSMIKGAEVRLYLTWDDLMRNIPFHAGLSNDSAMIDFGYVLKGNYYMTGSSGSLRDTGVAQILPQKTVTRNLFLR